MNPHSAVVHRRAPHEFLYGACHAVPLPTAVPRRCADNCCTCRVFASWGGNPRGSLSLPAHRDDMHILTLLNTHPQPRSCCFYFATGPAGHGDDSGPARRETVVFCQSLPLSHTHVPPHISHCLQRLRVPGCAAPHRFMHVDPLNMAGLRISVPTGHPRPLNPD